MALASVRALIFDLDGVLIDTEPAHKAAKQAALREFGIVLSDEEYLGYRGRSDADFAYAVGAAHGLPPARCAELLDLKHRLFEAGERDLELVPGARAFLELARPRFRWLAVTTSATPRNQAFAFDHFGLSGYFDAVVNAADITRTKPDPEPYLATLARLGLPAAACLVVEDSLNGILSASRAGCRVAAITTSYAPDELKASPADLVFEAYPELARHLGLDG